MPVSAGVLIAIAVAALVVIGIIKKVKNLITCAIVIGVVGAIAYFLLK